MGVEDEGGGLDDDVGPEAGPTGGKGSDEAEGAATILAVCPLVPATRIASNSNLLSSAFLASAASLNPPPE